MTAARPSSTRQEHAGWRAAVPAVLSGAAAWSWRILLVSFTAYALVWLMSKLALVVVPTFLALMFAALLHRPAAFLQQHRVPRTLASWITLILGFAVLAVLGYFVVTHISAHADELISQVEDVMGRLGQLVDRLPGLGSISIQSLQDRLVSWLQQHRMTVIGQALTTGRLLAELATGVAIALFLTFFFLGQGDRLWGWIVRLFPANAQASANGAGHRAWHVLSGWIVGTAVIAAIHGVVIGFVLWLLGTPLVVPLAVLVFVGSFIPLIGAFVFGGLAVLVTLLTVGVWPAVILVAVLLVENQLEGYVLQPLIVGRAVRLHPVAIVLVLTGAGVLAGLIGAIVAVPLVAAIHAAVKYLTGIEDLHGRPLREEDRMEPLSPPVVAPRRRRGRRQRPMSAG